MKEIKEKKRQLTIQMDNSLYEAFQKSAKNNGRSMGLLVRDFAKEYIKKNSQNEQN